MSRSICTACLAVLVAFFTGGARGATPDAPKAPEHKTDAEGEKADGHRFEPFKPESVTTNGSVTIGGRAITYQAVAGTLIVHPKGWDDVPRDPNADKATVAAAAAGTEGGRGRQSERRGVRVLCCLLPQRRRPATADVLL